MKEFIRLQLKLKWGFNRNNSKRSAFLTGTVSLLVIIVALALEMLLTSVLSSNLTDVSDKRLAMLFITIVELSLTVVGITMQLKRMYRPGDLHITARFPISPYKVYLCNLILIYIDLALYSAMLLLPILLVYGFVQGILSLVYVIGILLGVIFAPMVPFALSTLIAIPLMYVTSKLETHNIIRLSIFIVALVGFFVLYNYVLTVLADYFIHRNMSTDTLNIWGSLLGALDSYYNPAFYLGSIVFFDRAWLGLLVTVGLAALLSAAGIAIARPIYNRVRIDLLEGNGTTFRRRSRLDDYGPTISMLKHGFKEIIRTKTYSYFYLGIAIATPVMVFFCNRLITQVGQAQIGDKINFGASMLVISAFMAMISAFSANSLSMEGKNFYITKLVPVSYRKQLLIKGFLNLCVSIGALLISCVILVSLEFVSVGEMFILILTELLLTVGFVFNGLNLNLANPNLRPKANGEADEINITIMMLIGMVIGAIVGVLALVVPFFLQHAICYTIVDLTAAVYAAINVTIFVTSASVKYRCIEI
ncbi:MAG: hypothetical protein J1F68_00705 [Clostridiales bacterium]|nr:hypothetical protein [Clostridiales bacterium]